MSLSMGSGQRPFALVIVARNLRACAARDILVGVRMGGQWLQHGLVVGKMTRTSVVANEFWWWMKGLLLNPMLWSPGGSVCSMLSLLALSWRVLVGEVLGVLVLAEWDEKGVPKAFSHDPQKKTRERPCPAAVWDSTSLGRMQDSSCNTLTPLLGRTRSQEPGLVALSEAVESGLPTGEGPSRTPADSRKYCLGFFRVLWSCFGDLDVYRLVGGNDVVERKGQQRGDETMGAQAVRRLGVVQGWGNGSRAGATVGVRW